LEVVEEAHEALQGVAICDKSESEEAYVQLGGISEAVTGEKV